MFEEEYFKGRKQLETKHEYEVREWIKHFGLVQNNKVFVHGAGFGQRLHWFMELGMNAWGMDVSKYAIEHAYGQARGRITDWVPCNEISKDWYDLVVSVDVLEHIENYMLTNELIKLSALSNKAVYGITYIDNKNFPKDKTHITGKSKEEWRKLLLKYYDRVWDAPANWYESDMYLICLRFKK